MDDNMMGFLNESLNFMVAHAELVGKTCSLKHGHDNDAENPPAIDYLCQRLGNQKNNEAEQEVRIPICQECIEALYDPNWILMYCVYCHASQWIFRPVAKFDYPEGNGIYWLDLCPHCTEVSDEYGKNC
jgi:hypothetical protein